MIIPITLQYLLMKIKLYQTHDLSLDCIIIFYRSPLYEAQVKLKIFITPF